MYRQVDRYRYMFLNKCLVAKILFANFIQKAFKVSLLVYIHMYVYIYTYRNIDYSAYIYIYIYIYI